MLNTNSTVNVLVSSGNYSQGNTYSMDHSDRDLFDLVKTTRYLCGNNHTFFTTDIIDKCIPVSCDIRNGYNIPLK